MIALDTALKSFLELAKQAYVQKNIINAKDGSYVSPEARARTGTAFGLLWVSYINLAVNLSVAFVGGLLFRRPLISVCLLLFAAAVFFIRTYMLREQNSMNEAHLRTMRSMKEASATFVAQMGAAKADTSAPVVNLGQAFEVADNFSGDLTSKL